MERQRRPDPSPTARELDRLRSQNAQLRSETQSEAARYRKLQRSIQRTPFAKKPIVVVPPFELVDPRRSPKVGTKVLPALTPPIMVGRRMGAAIVAALREMAIETRSVIKSLAWVPDANEELSQVQGAMDAPPDGSTVAGKAQQRIEALYARWKARFAALAEEWSQRMITEVVAQSTAQLSMGLKDVAERTAIQSTLATPRMRTVVQAASQASTQLITRIPEKYLGEVQTVVMSAITTGSGLGELVPYLTKRYKGDVRHAQLTALDQVRKVSENVNCARVQSLGVEEYVWIHVGGERYPRKLHQSYSGRTFRYDDPPIIDERTGVRGKPGDAIFCRCRQRPVLNFTKIVATA